MNKSVRAWEKERAKGGDGYICACVRGGERAKEEMNISVRAWEREQKEEMNISVRACVGERESE